MTDIAAGRLVLVLCAAVYVAFAAIFPFFAIKHRGTAARYIAFGTIAVFLLGIPLLQLVSYRGLANVQGRVQDPWVLATLALEAIVAIAILVSRAQRQPRARAI